MAVALDGSELVIQNEFAKHEEIMVDVAGMTVTEEQYDTVPNGKMLKNKRVIEVTVIFMKLGEIDTLREQFSADILVTAKWREPGLDGKTDKDAINWNELWNPRLFIENTIGDSKETITRHVIHNSKNEVRISEKRRVKGSFVENLELNNFPFDVQDLTITLASERYSEELEFTADPTDMHKVCRRSFVDEQEWKLYKHIEVLKDEYCDEMASDDRPKPMYLVRCRAARRAWYFLVNMYTFTFLIVGLSLCTFSVSHAKPENRLQLSFTLLLTSVAFKLVINQSLPKISYMTYLDQYNMVSTGVMVMVCIWHAFASLLTEYSAIAVDKIAAAVFCFIFTLFNVIYVLYIYFTVYKKRRQMTQRDLDYMKQIRNAQSGIASARLLVRGSSKAVTGYSRGSTKERMKERQNALDLT